MRGRRLLAVLGACMLSAAVATPATATPEQSGLEAARGYAVMDARDGDLIDFRAANRRLPIASATKLMTAYVALRELPLNKMVRAAPYSPTPGESLLELRPGQRISVRDLLYGLILRSGNDAAYDLALAAAGSEAAFVRQMNRYAAALGLANTHYANPIGLDQPGNYSTARDLDALTRRLLQIPVFAKIAASRHAVLRSLDPPRRISTINEFLSMAPWATGVKTGHTDGARYVLVASGHHPGLDLITTVIGSPTSSERYEDALVLFKYSYSLYDRRVPIRAGEVLAEPSIRYQNESLPLRADRAVVVGYRSSQRLKVAVQAPDEVEGPVSRGAVLGRATVTLDGRRVATVPLKVAHAVSKASGWDRVRSFVEDNWEWFVLGLFGILVVVVLARRRSR